MELKSINIYEQRTKISQYDLEDIFFIQYNDLFSKLLKKSIDDFFSILKKQVIFHLKIIDKQFDSSLLSFFYEKYYYICQKDKLKIQNIYNKITSYPTQNFISLNVLDIYIHCYKCKEAIHKCGNELIIYDDLYFCLKCQKVYNQNEIKLFCKECKKEYLTTKRSVSDRNHDYFYPVSYMNYHCYIENEEKIKCLNCGDDLYYNITKIKTDEQNRIRDIYCIKCKLIFDTKKIYFKCKVCGDNFRCEPQIYRNFSSTKKYLLLLVRTFRRGIYAFPNIISNKKCNCDLNGILYFLHQDNGILYQGKKNGKNVIICNCCYGIFKPDNFNWNCPFCKKNFRTLKEYEYEMPSQPKKIIKTQKKAYIANSNINIYNNFYSQRNSNYRYNNSYGYPNDNISNNSKHLIQNTSFCHNRGLTLNNEYGQKRCLYLIDKNKNLNIHKSANRILLNVDNYTRNTDFTKNFSYDKKLIKTENIQTSNPKQKNIQLKKKYLNKESKDFGSPIMNNSKISTSYLNISYNNNNTTSNNTTEISNNINNKNFILSPISNNTKVNIELPHQNNTLMKGSKSVNNLKKKVKIDNPEPQNITNRRIIKKTIITNIPIQNYIKNSNNANNKSYINKNYFINTSINNNLIQMNYSSNIDSELNKNKNVFPNNQSLIQNIEQKNDNKRKNLKISKIINNININNNDMNPKKIIKEQNVQDKNRKKDNIKVNPFKAENNQNIINRKENIYKNVNNTLNNSKNIIKIENKNKKIFVSTNDNINKNNNINNKKIEKQNGNNNVNQIVKKDEKDKKENISFKNINKNFVSKILNKFQKEQENEKNQEDCILYRNKNNIINNNIQTNKFNNIKISEISDIKKVNQKETNLPRYNVFNNENDSKNKKEINNNNVYNMNNKENKNTINNKENKELKTINAKQYKKIVIEERKTNQNIITNKNNTIVKDDKTEKKINKIKIPLDNNSNKIKKENIIKSNVHKKNLSYNSNQLNNTKNESNNINKKINIILDKKNDDNNNLKNNVSSVNLKNFRSQKKDNNIKLNNDENNNKIKNIENSNIISKRSSKKINENNNIKNNNINTEKNPLIKNNTNNNLINNKNNYKSTNNILINKNKIKNNIIINDNNAPNNKNININEKINKSTNNILVNNKSNIIIKNKIENYKSQEKKGNNEIKNLDNLNNTTNFGTQINNKPNIIFNNRLNVTSIKKLSKSINFNQNIKNIDSNLKRNINNDIYNNKNKTPSKNILNNTNKDMNNINNLNNTMNYNISMSNKENFNLLNKNEQNVNNLNISYNNLNNSNIKIIYKSESKSNNNLNINNLNYFNNSKNNIIINKNLMNYIFNGNGNENINIDKKLGNNIYKNISKSINNNLISNDNNINTNNLNKNSINSNINPNNILKQNKQQIINKEINNQKEQNKIINHNDNHPKDSIRTNNINNNIINQTDPQNNKIITLNNKKPSDNIKENKKIILNKNENINNNLVLKENNKRNQVVNLNSNYVIKLKMYFHEMAKIKNESYLRRLSFDCRQSTNHFKIFNNKNHIELKTFDSNYYKIIRQIGKGTYGEIYLVQDPKTSAYYALKKIIISDALELRDNQEEYKLTWKLTHANPDLKIAKKLAIEIKKLDKYNLVMYVLMEAANCDWEHELLNRQKANAFYTENELLTILKSLVYTFSVLQKKGISHRDVKPQNILCFGNEGYKLTDFGEAKHISQQNGIKNLYGFEQNTNKQTVRGTELYMSPILFRALQTNNIDCAQYNAYKSDVFSLGMCFLFASSLNYKSLFEIREVYDMKIIEQIVNRYLGKLYSKNYINLIIKMLQVDEKLRPDFNELISAFN